MNEKLGLYLTNARKNASLSQKQVATILNIKPSTLCKYEKGTLEPHVETLKKLSFLYKVSLEYLTGFVYEKNISNKEMKSIIAALYSKPIF